MQKYARKVSQKQNANLICLDELRPLTHQHLRDWAFNICPCIDSEMNAGMLQAQAIKLCPNKTEVPLGDILEDMHMALKSA